MSIAIRVTYTCDSCGKEVDKGDAAGWIDIMIHTHGEADAGVRRQACSKRCARMLLIFACNKELNEDAP